MIQRIRSFHQKHRYKVHSATRFSVYLLAFFVLCLVYWIQENFGEPSLEQILYHLQFGAEGLVDADKGITRSFIKFCLLLPVPLAFAAVTLEKALRYARMIALSKALGVDSSPINKHISRIFRALDWAIGHKAPLYLLIFSIVYFGVKFSADVYIHNQFGKDYFAQNYVNPAQVGLTAKRPRNLVLIYVESMEDSYKDPRLFGKNLLESLDKLPGTSFANYRQAPGTGWTIAGITATNCGVPLKSVTMFDGNDQGENIKSFLPNAVCLSDILSNLGFRNVYMGGDALSFSGKGKFFKDHHYDETYGREELKGDITKQRMNFWGLYDDDLLSKAKLKLKQLHDDKRPFNLTITTIDTHGPDGHYSTLCKQQGAKDFPGIVECTANQVADFVRFMKRSGYLRNTNVVILGDHLAMYNPVSSKLDLLPERYVYNRFISARPIGKNRETVVHFDMLPTILEFIGVQVDGGRLGLGYSAISKDGALPSPNEFEEMNEDLLNNSDEYLKLWDKN